MAKGSLGWDSARTPRVQEFFLPFAQQLETRQIDRLRIVAGIVEMIWSRSHFRNLTSGSGLEFAIFEYCKVDSADTHAGKVDGDTSINGRRIDCVGQMPGLLTLHEVDIFNWIKVAAVGVAAERRASSVFAPEIRVADVVIVRNCDGGSVAHDVAKLQSEFNPAGCMFGVSIRLITRKE